MQAPKTAAASVGKPKYRPPTKASDPTAFAKMMRRRNEAAMRNARLELLAKDDPNALQSIATVQSRTGLSAATIYRKLRAGQFPEPVRMGKRCTRWPAAAITSWLAAQVEA